MTTPNADGRKELWEQARIARLATAELRAQGLSLRAIAELTGESITLVARRLHRHAAYVEKGTDPAIIPPHRGRLMGRDDATPNPATVKRLLKAKAATTRQMGAQAVTSGVRRTEVQLPESLSPEMKRGITCGTSAIADLRAAEASVVMARARRDRAILRLHDAGLTLQQIAKALGLSSSTVTNVARSYGEGAA